MKHPTKQDFLHAILRNANDAQMKVINHYYSDKYNAYLEYQNNSVCPQLSTRLAIGLTQAEMDMVKIIDRNAPDAKKNILEKCNMEFKKRKFNLGGLDITLVPNPLLPENSMIMGNETDMQNMTLQQMFDIVDKMKIRRQLIPHEKNIYEIFRPHVGLQSRYSFVDDAREKVLLLGEREYESTRPAEPLEPFSITEWNRILNKQILKPEPTTTPKLTSTITYISPPKPMGLDFMRIIGNQWEWNIVRTQMPTVLNYESVKEQIVVRIKAKPPVSE